MIRRFIIIFGYYGKLFRKKFKHFVVDHPIFEKKYIYTVNIYSAEIYFKLGGRKCFNEKD